MAPSGRPGNVRVLVTATTEGGSVVGDLKDPVAVETFRVAGSEELQAFDRRRGVATRRMRTEYRGFVGPWLDPLCLTLEAARRAVAPTPWHVSAVLDREGGRYFPVVAR